MNDTIDYKDLENFSYPLPFCANLSEVFASKLARRLSVFLIIKDPLLNQEAIKNTIAGLFDDSLSWDKLGEEERGPIGSILKENKSMIEEILTHLVNNQQTYSISSGYLKTSAHQEGMIKITETDDHSFAVSIDPLIEAVLQIGSPDTDPTRKSNRDRLSKNTTLIDDYYDQKNDKTGKKAPIEFNLQYIIDQCDEFMNNGRVTFDYTHNGIPGCTKFNIPTTGYNVFRPLLHGDLPMPDDGDYFCTTNEVGFMKNKFQVYLHAMKNNKGELTDTISDWINEDSKGNINYFKKLALDYEMKGLIINNNSDKFCTFLDDLAKKLDIPSDGFIEKLFAKLAYQYIMANIMGRYRKSKSYKKPTDFYMVFPVHLRRWIQGEDDYYHSGILFAGSA